MSVLQQDAELVRTPIWRVRSLAGAVYLIVALAAALPRIIGLGQFLTVDEGDHWMQRSADFMAALQSGHFADTAITAHPGVTTMWLGGLGLLLHQRAVDLALVPAASFAAKLALMQLPVALVNAGAVVLGYFLLRRLLAGPTALLAALLWAADPFVIGYSRVLHVDALAGTFITLSALAACCYWHHERSARWLILSGICGGLALLSKSPSAVMLPWVGLLALGTWNQEPRTKNQEPSSGSRFSVLGSPRRISTVEVRSLVTPLLIWGAVAGVTVLLLWPAALVAPVRVLDLLRSGVEENGAVPHSNGNFFLGRPDPAPGPLFYPVALALRTTPLTLIGLLLLPLAAWRAQAAARRDYAALAGLVILLVVGLSLFPKKHNRYLEPAFPAADILAAAGLASVLSSPSGRGRRAAAATAALGAVAVANAVSWHPYGIAAFNQLLGGAPAGANTFLIGWGEGLEQAAAWLNQQPDIAQTQVATEIKDSLGRYLAPGARVLTPRKDITPGIGYVVVYARYVQGEAPDPPFDQFYGRAEPAHVVQIHGVPYAWIYQVAPATAQPSAAEFGGALRLRGYTLAAQPGQAGAYALRLAWQATQPLADDYAAFVHLIGPDGQRYAQLDPRVPSAGLAARRYLTTDLVLQLPANAPPGQYRLVIGLYEPASGRRLALGGVPAVDPALDGPDALLLDTASYPR
jgi:4-amino-4-deoxy-L-arabinose transferase-like glycosyltransferase